MTAPYDEQLGFAVSLGKVILSKARLIQTVIKKLGKTIIAMAEAEGLDAHANAVKIRINKQ